MVEEKWYLARQCIPDMLVRCTHGAIPVCDCVTRFNVDKDCLLTKEQRTATAAQYEINRMERLNEQDERKFRLLTQISRCEENTQTIYDNEYEPNYGCLMPSSPLPTPQSNRFILFMAFIFLVLLSLFVLIMVNINTWYPTEYLYTRNMFATFRI
jgi:hypothetical protein